MLAATMALQYGKKLVGRQVRTQPMGEWPGGVATVTQVGHDRNAPEIVFLVKKRGWKDGEMGVFDYEDVTLVPAKAAKKRGAK